jgi:hypothetical protein
MAPVVVELGAQSGLIIPLIAVHLFVFYYGIMGDITPPVGLATFAAAAISGEDAIKTGIQGSLYALRTVILPFIWIFNPQLLLIDIHSTGELIRVVAACVLATLVFAAVTMNWFRVKSRLWETLALCVAVALLFRPDFFMDLITPEYRDVPASQVLELARAMQDRASVAICLLNLAMVAVDRGGGARARQVLSEALEISRSLGSKPAEQSVLEVCAGLAAMLQDWDRAATFFGTAEEQASRTGIHRDPADDAFLMPWMEKAHAALGAKRFAAREAEGRARDFDGLLDEARAWLSASS